jgi:hypothetical protein
VPSVLLTGGLQVRVLPEEPSGRAKSRQLTGRPLDRCPPVVSRRGTRTAEVGLTAVEVAAMLCHAQASTSERYIHLATAPGSSEPSGSRLRRSGRDPAVWHLDILGVTRIIAPKPSDWRLATKGWG